MPGVRMAPGRVMSIPCAACLFGGGGGLEGLLDLLLELVEADAERLFCFGRCGFEPCFADELEAPLLAAQPVETEGFDVGGVGSAGLFGESGEGLVEGWFVEGLKLRNGVVHECSCEFTGLARRKKQATTKAKCGGLSTAAAKAPPSVEMTILWVR